MSKIKTITPTLLIILDGFGYKKDRFGNAIKNAKMPNLTKWKKRYPSKLLKASGKAVGLPKGFIGNSEVGHLTIGSGRIIKTVLLKFNENIKSKKFFKNKIVINNFKKIKNNNSLHFIGLLSDAGVHSLEKHLFAFLKSATIRKVQNIFIHAFLDGRDVPPKSATKYLQKLSNVCKKLNCGKIASLHGRFYAMDRDNNWSRTEKSYNVLCNKKTKIKYDNWKDALKDSYKNKISDEFFKPTLLIKEGQIKKNDGIVFFNFRPDRARQITEPFINPKFNKFKTFNLNSTTGTLKFFITITRYKKQFVKFNNEILYKDEKIKNTLIDEISKQTPALCPPCLPKNPPRKCKKKIFIIAETEKYAHVTYFFRGLNEKKLEDAKYILISSIKAKTYIKHPDMSAEKITENVLKSLQQKPVYFYLINYANADMVGHSGNFEATIKACEFVDKQLERLYKEVIIKQNGTIFITADHGNAEEMKYTNGKPKTSHTTNPVIFLKINKKVEKNLKNIPIYKKPTLGLSNIAPTILKYLKLRIPREMVKKTIK